MVRKNEAHDIVVESLTEALLYLLEAKQLADISVSELCARAGVSRISYYRNYSSLADILVRHLNKCTDDWWLVFSKKSGAEFYTTFLEELLLQYKNNEQLIKLLYRNDLAYIMKEHIFNCCLSSVEERDAEDAYTRAALAGALYGLVDEWVRRGMHELPKGFSLRRILHHIPD